MKLFMYAIYDRCSGVYDRPFCMQSDAAAIRAFKDIACDSEHPIGKHPEDYSMFRVALFDDNNGKVSPQKVECIARAHELAASVGQVIEFPEADDA